MPGRPAFSALATPFALLALVLASGPLHAQSRVVAEPAGAWGALPGAEPCMSEDDLERRLARDPAVASRRALIEQLVEAATRQKLLPNAPFAASPAYTIPVAVHIVHQGGIENISDQQVLSQLYALNRDFADSLNHGSPAVDTRISFCLAQNLPAASTVTWSTTPGITRTFSSETNHLYANPTSETALKAIAYLPSDKYLNIWIVKTITGGPGSVAGYGTFPGSVPQTLDGIVIRADAFGSDLTPFGGPYALLAGNNDGKILTHEVGHWLNLYHTFHGGCSGVGDQVADTPSEQVLHTGCPSPVPSSCTAAPDPVENFMDYTTDACRYAFTAGQQLRMQVALAGFRTNLASASNLLATGCSSGLDPLIIRTPGQLCAGGTVQVTTTAQAVGMTYAWLFPGGSPATATTQNASVTYATPGVYPVTLTVTTAANASATNSAQVYVLSCTPIGNRCTNWTFGAGTGVSFASGVPVAVSGRIPAAIEAATTMSDASGNLLFYSDGVRVIDRTNTVMPNGGNLDIGGSSHTGVIAVPRPGSASQYYLFGARMAEDAPVPFPFTYSVVDMALNGGFGDVPAGQKNLPITVPGNPTFTLEAVAAIPHCNGHDWWLLTHGAYLDSYKIYVTLFTATGPVSTQVFPIGLDIQTTWGGMMRPTPDGTKFTLTSPFTKELAVYNFNRTTGAVTVSLAATVLDANADAVLSPNKQIVYFTYLVNGISGVRQLDLATMQVREVLTNATTTIEPGPDGRIYVAQIGQTALHTINFPDQFNLNNQNECGLNLLSVPLITSSGIHGSLPNMAGCNGATLAADFTSKITNCLTVQFATNNCTGPFSWNFGDAATGTGATVTHTYAAPGTYTVTLTAPGSSPSVAVKTLTLGLAPVSIAGSNTACTNPNNYSVIGPANYTYSWFVSGGTPSFGAGNSVDVAWLATGGSLQLTATDPATGCTTTLNKLVGPCPTCKSPPLNMSAWWPLDEPLGTTAIETVQGNHGSDVAGPLHGPGMVRRARIFNGTTQLVEANDAPALNFGTGDLTVDAWVRTQVATGVQRIVDKRLPDPAQGWSLYLRDGRLALGLGAPPSASITEYWLPTTPFVADGQWHHVAGVLERADAGFGTRLYVDGSLVATWPAFTATGNLTSTAKLRIGAGAGFGPPVEYFAGGIDEVELFQRAIPPSDVLGIMQADTLGKCKEFVYVPKIANLCRDVPDVTVTASICNWSSAPQTYTLACTGLATGPGCTFAGPTAFQILGPSTITVPPSSCVPVQVKITRPPAMPLYATSCWQLAATNTSNSLTIVGQGAIVASRQWCMLVAALAHGVTFGGTGTSTQLRFHATNQSGGPLTTPYSVQVVAAPGSEGGGDGLPGDPPGVTLNGLPPGAPLKGQLSLADGEGADLDVLATFSEPRAFRFYDVVLAMDEDKDGTSDTQAAQGLTFREGGAPQVDVPHATPPLGAPPSRLELGAPRPNPVAGFATVSFALPSAGEVTLTLHDVAGRRVRTLYRGDAVAGPGAMQVDCGGLARGMYFLRLTTAGGSAARRVMIVR